MSGCEGVELAREAVEREHERGIARVCVEVRQRQRNQTTTTLMRLRHSLIKIHHDGARRQPRLGGLNGTHIGAGDVLCTGLFHKQAMGVEAEGAEREDRGKDGSRGCAGSTSNNKACKEKEEREMHYAEKVTVTIVTIVMIVMMI